MFISEMQREIGRIAIPVGLEMVAQLLFGLIDQVIVGRLGAVVIAAIGVSNGAILIGTLTLTMFGTGTSILVAQAQGGGQLHLVARISIVTVLLATALAAVLAVPLAAFALPFLRAIGADPAVAVTGRAYFQVAALTLPLAVLNAVVTATLRALGRPRVPMIVTLGAVLLNTAAGYMLVFGLGPLPALGAVGAAWATLIAQSIKAGVLLKQLFGRRSPIGRPSIPSLDEWRRLSQAQQRLTLPLSVKELFWSSGVFLYTVLFAHVGTSALAASQIVAALEAVFIVASIGLMTAATILIGQAVGANDMELARTRERALLRAGMVTGLAFAAAYMSTIAFLPIFYPHVGADVLQIAIWGIVINSMSHVVKVRNMIVVGMLPSGGDTRGVVIGDIAGAFTIGLPVGYLLTFQLGLGVWGIFAGRAVEELVKLAFFGWRASRLPWGRHAVHPTAVTVL